MCNEFIVNDTAENSVDTIRRLLVEIRNASNSSKEEVQENRRILRPRSRKR